MKHRSVIAFIILAAAFVAAPQVSQDFAALKSALGSRIRGEILHAFLSLHANDGAGGSKARRAAAAPMLASCKAEVKPDAQAAAAPARRAEERAQVLPRAEAAPQPETHKQMAMLIVPSPEAEEPGAELQGVDDQFIRGKSAGLPRRADSEGELAMLIPPGLGIDIRSDAPGDHALNVAGDAQAGRKGAGQRRSAGSRRQAAPAAARFEYTAHFESAAAKFQSEEVLRNLGPLVREAVWTRAAEQGVKVRVFKSRRKAAGVAPAVAPQPAPAAALGVARPAPPFAIQTSAGE